MGIQCQWRFICLTSPSLWPMLDIGKMVPCPWGRGMLMSGWDLWWCHKHNACHWREQVSFDACSVSKLPSSKHSGFESCEWRLVLSEITVLRLHSSHHRVFLSSQLFIVDSRRSLSHTQGINLLPTLQTPLVCCGAVVPSVSGSQLCSTVSHTPVPCCCIHISHSNWRIDTHFVYKWQYHKEKVAAH